MARERRFSLFFFLTVVHVGLHFAFIIASWVTDIQSHHLEEWDKDGGITIPMIASCSDCHHGCNANLVSLWIDDSSLLDHTAAYVSKSMDKGAKGSDSRLEAHASNIG